jgi:hypothetical protein
MASALIVPNSKPVQLLIVCPVQYSYWVEERVTGYPRNVLMCKVEGIRSPEDFDIRFSKLVELSRQCDGVAPLFQFKHQGSPGKEKALKVLRTTFSPDFYLFGDRHCDWKFQDLRSFLAIKLAHHVHADPNQSDLKSQTGRRKSPVHRRLATAAAANFITFTTSHKIFLTRGPVIKRPSLQTL